MLLRIVSAFVTMAALMWLVKLQIRAAHKDKFLTVEQLAERGIKGLSFDRHYAMPIDYSIFPGYVALCIILSAGQWTYWNGWVAAIASVVVILLCMFTVWIGGTEAHVHDGKPTEAGWLRGIFAMVVTGTFIMVLVFTPRPEPVLLLITLIVMPAFFFVGTHLFLKMINFKGAATMFNGGRSLKDPVAWTLVVGSALLVGVRSYFLIPSSFWAGLN